MEHRGVVGRIERPEAGSESAHAARPVDLEIQDLDHERIARLGALDRERPGQRVVALHLRQAVPGLLDHAAEAVGGPSLEDVARL
jgi:hypothetical protein